MTQATPVPSLDDLRLNEPQAIADQFGIPVMYVDHQATRRQRLHGASVPGRTDTFSASHMHEVLDWLDDCGYRQAIMLTETPKLEILACYIEFFPLE